jgi:hypothetical protein
MVFEQLFESGCCTDKDVLTLMNTEMIFDQYGTIFINFLWRGQINLANYVHYLFDFENMIGASQCSVNILIYLSAICNH